MFYNGGNMLVPYPQIYSNILWFIIPKHFSVVPSTGISRYLALAKPYLIRACECEGPG